MTMTKPVGTVSPRGALSGLLKDPKKRKKAIAGLKTPKVNLGPSGRGPAKAPR